MAQVFNLKGSPIQNISEIRTNLIKDETGVNLIMSFDPTSNGVTLHNVEFLWTVNGTKITANNIVTNP